MKKINKLLFLFTGLIFIINALAKPSFAQICSPPCKTNETCRFIGVAAGRTYCAPNPPTGNGNTTNIFGQIINPIKSGTLGPGGGLIALLNNVIRLVIVVAGIYAFIQLIIAGLGFIDAAGDVKKIEKSWKTIWQSILGLVIIIGSIAIAALMGQLLFGDPSAILNPKIYGPGV